MSYEVPAPPQDTARYRTPAPCDMRTPQEGPGGYEESASGTLGLGPVDPIGPGARPDVPSRGTVWVRGVRSCGARAPGPRQPRPTEAPRPETAHPAASGSRGRAGLHDRAAGPCQSLPTKAHGPRTAAPVALGWGGGDTPRRLLWIRWISRSCRKDRKKIDL